jgi:hypothetical protein
MNKRITHGLIAAVLSMGVAGIAFAGPTPVNTSEQNGEHSLQHILNYITEDGTSSIDVNALGANGQLPTDSYFRVNSEGSGDATILIEIAGHRNINQLGIFDRDDPGNTLLLFDGSDSASDSIQLKRASCIPGHSGCNPNTLTLSGTSKSITLGSSNEFGYFLRAGDDGQPFYSDMSLNSDGADHLVGFQGNDDQININCARRTDWTTRCPAANYYDFDPGEIIFGWEDVSAAGWDQDYNDFVFETQSMSAVPGPGVLGMFGLGLLMLVGGLRWRGKAR